MTISSSENICWVIPCQEMQAWTWSDPFQNLIKICQVVTICKNFKNSSQISCADQEKSVIKVSVVRLKARKLGAQSKFSQFLELYISESTNPRNLEFYRLNLASRLLNNTKAISKYIMATQKHKKIVGRDFLHFWIPIKPKPNKSRFSTLLTLPDHMEGY